MIAFGSAIDYLSSLDRYSVAQYENELLTLTTNRLKEIEGLRIIGNAKDKAGIVSFIIDGLNAMDVGMYLDTQGIAVRTGHHCTEPVMKRMNIPGTIRASFLFYNTPEEIDDLIDGVRKAIALLRK